MNVETPLGGIQAIRDYFMDNGMTAVPEDTRDQFKSQLGANGTSALGAFNLTELIYARRDEMPAELLTIAAALAIVFYDLGMFEMRTDERGYMMAMTIRQMEAVAAPPPPPVIEAPEPKPEYVPVLPEEDPEPPA